MSTATPEKRRKLIDDIMQQHAMGNETLGTAIRRLRLEVTGFDQDTFAAMCNLSTKALYQIEKDKGNPTLGTLESILRKFGLRLGLMSLGKTAYTPPLGQPEPALVTPSRGANPKRKRPPSQAARLPEKMSKRESREGD